MSTPSPSLMPKFKAPAIIATTQVTEPAKIVRPGMREQVTAVQHDGVVKAKNLKKGQVVRAWLHGGPKGGERVVESVERIEDGAMVRVTFSSPHPTTDYKAAYRFYDASLVGTTVEHITKQPALVPYEEV